MMTHNFVVDDFTLVIGLIHHFDYANMLVLKFTSECHSKGLT